MMKDWRRSKGFLKKLDGNFFALLSKFSEMICMCLSFCVYDLMFSTMPKSLYIYK